MPKTRPKSFSKFLSILFTGLLLSWGIFALSLFLVLAQTWLYPLFSKDRVNAAGLREEVIQENYRTLIAYNLSPGGGPLNFQGLSMSREGRIHFKEVKGIFQTILWTGAVALALAIFLGRRSLRKGGKPAFLLYACRISMAIPPVLGLFMAMNFDRAFVLFHQLLFDNDYWIFDPARDPIIHYLPESFFLSMGAVILGLWTLGIVLVRFVLYPRLKKGGETREPGGRRPAG